VVGKNTFHPRLSRLPVRPHPGAYWWKAKEEEEARRREEIERREEELRREEGHNRELPAKAADDRRRGITAW